MNIADKISTQNLIHWHLKMVLCYLKLGKQFWPLVEQHEAKIKKLEKLLNK